MATPTAQTGAQVISDALLAINVIRAGQTPSAEQQAQGIRRLNQMMAMWEVEGNNLGYIPIGTVTQTLTVPDAAILGIVNNLAILWAPFFGATASAEVVALAERGMDAIEKICSQEVQASTELQPSTDRPRVFNIQSGQ